MTDPVPFIETINGILFHGQENDDGSESNSPPSPKPATLLHRHPEVLAWLHFAGNLPIRPDAAIFFRTLDEKKEDAASLAETLRSEISSRGMYEELLQAVRRTAENVVTEEPNSLWVGETFDYNRGKNVERLGGLGPTAITDSVFAMSYVPLKTVVACKILSSRDKIAAATPEAEILKTLEHPNVVKFLGFERTRHRESMVFMEFIDGGTVEALAETLRGLTESDAAIITSQILHGLAYLHAHQIIHRNIRGANILVTLQGRIKISELGCAAFPNVLHTMTKNSINQYHARSPEMFNEQEYDSRTDIWSLGNVILELVAGGHPWKREKQSLFYVLTNIINRKMPIPDDISHSLRDLLSAIFQPQESRPTAEKLLSDVWVTRKLGHTVALDCSSFTSGPQDILEHPWFRGADWDAREISDPQTSSKDDTRRFLPLAAGNMTS